MEKERMTKSFVVGRSSNVVKKAEVVPWLLYQYYNS